MAQRNEGNGPGMLRFGDSRDMQFVGWELEKEDVMKLKPIYEALYMFLRDEGFEHPFGGEPEDLYWERWVPSGAKEQHIWWRVRKDINRYIRYFMHIDFQTLNVTKAEVAWKNKKVSGEKIDLIIRVKIWLQWDVENLFQDSFAWQFKKMFFNRMYVQEQEQHRLNILQLSGRIQRLIRHYFEMAADDEHLPIMQPVMGYKEP
jgi:hypothetical protein